MIGIYKIQNIQNNKIYIGQSNNIKRRFQEHKTKGKTSRIPVDLAIEKYGVENFTFEVVEEVNQENLNEKESYWIQYYDSKEKGYNCSIGGDFQSIGENNGRSKLTEEDVKEIRQSYKLHLKRREVYKKYEEKISFDYFASIWDGSHWSHIMPEVFTEENRVFYSKQATNGELSSFAAFTNKEVISFRKRYVQETAKEIYKDVKDKISFESFQKILCGKSYKNLPIYLKKKKEWINL